jgi:lysylphosphatidylglycerol synthetase-like protein (DUF2156 family)
MSTTQSPIVQPVVVPPTAQAQRELYIYSHSSLYYWWPVWAVGFLMAILTFWDGHRMAIVPPGTIAESSRTVEGHESEGPLDVLIVSKGKKLPIDPYTKTLLEPKLHMAQSKNLGVIFASILLLIILISNVPLRGLWSLLIILFIILMVVIFALAGWWDIILEKVSLLQVHINAGGYLFIAIALLIIWALTIFVFDHRTYVVVTPGQVRVCLAVGAGETVYDTTGMTFQKQQNDFFRHWIVGLGSGDLIIHRSNTNQEIDMPNVLFIGAKVKEIEQLIKERPVV